MKLVRFGKKGKEKPGLVDSKGRIRDLSNVIIDVNKYLLSNMEMLEGIDIETLPLISENVRFGPCFADIGNIFCIGLNYVKHAEESNLALPQKPTIFMKSTSAISGPNDPIIMPKGSEKTDWEVELAIIIGKKAKNLNKEEALSYVAGYCIMNDVSERGLQMETSQWVRGKSCDSFAPIGPWFVTVDEIKNPNNLRIWLKVNGEVMQHSNTSDMVFDVPTLISDLSKVMTLQPGDIISTGTPSGVGMGFKPPKYLKKGDKVLLGIEGLGVQYQEVIEEK